MNPLQSSVMALGLVVMTACAAQQSVPVDQAAPVPIPPQPAAASAPLETPQAPAASGAPVVTAVPAGPL
ncbi:MAG: hypothetical protein QM639_16880, partial [Rhodocyclaceae bacterium]